MSVEDGWMDGWLAAGGGEVELLGLGLGLDWTGGISVTSAVVARGGASPVPNHNQP